MSALCALSFYHYHSAGCRRHLLQRMMPAAAGGGCRAPCKAWQHPAFVQPLTRGRGDATLSEADHLRVRARLQPADHVGPSPQLDDVRIARRLMRPLASIAMCMRIHFCQLHMKRSRWIYGMALVVHTCCSCDHRRFVHAAACLALLLHNMSTAPVCHELLSSTGGTPTSTGTWTSTA
jgi:hypothetical protein